MWLALSDGWLSIVAHRDKPDHLLVRARKASHIEDYFPNESMYEDSEADYPFRADVMRYQVSLILAEYIDNMQYDNFKNSVEDKLLRFAFTTVHADMMQYGLKYRPKENTTHIDESVWNSWGRGY
tara:strand:+ start:449 stop:823 length:375 start_codon:yes stop_codon:yes gene_type:complete